MSPENRHSVRGARVDGMAPARSKPRGENPGPRWNWECPGGASAADHASRRQRLAHVHRDTLGVEVDDRPAPESRQAPGISDDDFPAGMRNALLISIAFWIAVFFVAQWVLDWVRG